MAGMDIVVSGANFGPTGWATGAALARQNFVGNAAQAFVFDPSIMGGMFQDREMTLPVTAPGQNVLAMADRSGRGLHAILSAGATGTPIWQSSGGISYVSIPLNAPFEISNPMMGSDDFSIILAARVTGGTSASERSLVSQMGSSSASFLAMQVGQRSGLQGMNLTTTGGWELAGAAIADSADYVMGFRRNAAGSAAALRLGGVAGATISYTPPAVAMQPTTLIFGGGSSGTISQSTSGRLYYAAFTKAARDDVTFAALEAVAGSRITG